MTMSKTKWAFDEAEFKSLIDRCDYIGSKCPVHFESVKKFIQAACEAHARKEVKKLRKEIAMDEVTENDCQVIYVADIDAALKKRGIVWGGMR